VPVPEGQQVLCRRARPKRALPRSRDTRIDDDKGIAAPPQRLQLRLRLLGQHQHGTVGRWVHQAVEQGDLPFVLMQGGAEDDAHALLVERFGRAREDDGEVGSLDDRRLEAVAAARRTGLLE
jgi:hypothetical protein